MDSLMWSRFYGCSFDPVHWCHVGIARAASGSWRAEVRLVPAANPPHRELPSASAEHRARMLALAIADEPGMRVDERELHRGGPSWRSEEHTSELQSLMRISYAVFCLKKKNMIRRTPEHHRQAKIHQHASY